MENKNLEQKKVATIFGCLILVSDRNRSKSFSFILSNQLSVGFD